MEYSMAAVAAKRGVEFGQLLYTADSGLVAAHDDRSWEKLPKSRLCTSACGLSTFLNKPGLKISPKEESHARFLFACISLEFLTCFG